MFAWSNRETPDELQAAERTFPGLGLVLKPGNLGVAERLSVPPIAYIGSVAHAESVAALARAGVPFTAALVMDELNADGPSGRYMPPAVYAERFTPIRDALAGLVPVHTMGLQPVGGWWRELLRRRHFDDVYHAALPPADGRAFNPNKVRLTEVRRVLDTYDGPWVLSPAPFRSWWDRANEPVSVRQWAALAKRPDVTAVALWCLREVHAGAYFGNRWQSEHGLLDRHGNLTNVGRAVLSA